jgi:uncharacterized protein DUF6600
MNTTKFLSIMLAVVMTLGMVSATPAADPPPPQGSAPSVAGDEGGLTPPRLSYTDGEVSFWRPGAPDWTAAQINIPLAPNDELYTGPAGSLEIQIGTRAFARGWADTQLGLVNLEPDFLQVKVTAGHAALDVRMLEPGRTIELDTPHAAFTIEQAGYYRVDVTQDRTQLITRRGARATMIPPGGTPMAIAPSEELVVEGLDSPRVEAYVAPELDTWDRWNYARTDELIDSVSTRYVSSGVYGVDDLDHYGTWRVVPTYGSIWVPDNMPSGWVPYSTGSWVWDPNYGWTWVDTAPWGWAPYHHGRWVFVNGFWAWAPGPPVVRAAYAPALVVFFAGAPSARVVSGPAIAWCALGWGEPLVPWWGRPGFAGSPWWGGWGGPRVVNNVVVRNTTTLNVQNITVYQNANIHQAVVAVDREHFGRHPVREARVTAVNPRDLRPVHGPLQVKPTPASLVPEIKQAAQPPKEVLAKPVVATRAPHPARAAAAVAGDPAAGSVTAPRSPIPAPRLVSPPKSANPAVVSPRPPLGSSPIERPRPSPPQSPGEPQHPPAAVQNGPTHQPAAPTAPPPPGGPTAAIPPRPPRAEPGSIEPQRPAPQVTAPASPAPPDVRRPAPSEVRPAPSRPEPRPIEPGPQPPTMARPAPEDRRQPGTFPPPTTAPTPPVPSQVTPPQPGGARPELARPDPGHVAPTPSAPPQVSPPEIKPESGRPRPPASPPPAPAPSQVRPEPARPEPRANVPAQAPPPQVIRPTPPPAPPTVTRPAPHEGRPEAPRPAPPAPQSPARRDGSPAPPATGLPGEPANRLYPGRSERKSPGTPMHAQPGGPSAPASREHPERFRG